MIILVTGVVQFVTAPIAAALEQRFDERYLTAFGFLLFGVGLAMSCVQTSATDYDQMFWPQVVRGFAVMFCILPPTRLALGHLAKAGMPDASGLFNLMRNLGGAIGIALIDTVIYTRAPMHARELSRAACRRRSRAAPALGLPQAGSAPALDAATQAMLPADTRLPLPLLNEAWALVALMTLAVLRCCAARPNADLAHDRDDTQRPRLRPPAAPLHACCRR